MKQSFYNNYIMKIIKACELKPGDIFKTNPRLHKEHWADKVVTEDDKVSIDTWARTHLELSPQKEVFLIRSTNPERKEVTNG